MAILHANFGEEAGQEWTIDGERSILGRHPDCEVVLDAASVSRQHAQILREGDRYYVEDLHSRNGTYVNGEMIQGRHLLADGDRLKICDHGFTFYSSGRRDPQLAYGGIDSSRAMVVDDATIGMSSVMSKLDVAVGRSGAYLSVNTDIKLRAMMEIAMSLGKAVSLDEVLQKILDGLFRIFIQADRGFIVLRAAPTGPLVPKAVKYRRADMEDQIRISRTIITQVMDSQEAILSADASNDARFETSQSIADLRIRSVMCVPLVDSDNRSMGVLQVDTMDQRHRFQKEDLEVLASIAAQAAVAVDNAQMHESALKQQAVQRDLDLAQKVQRGLLPSAPPRMAGYHFFDFYEAANQVGGDYYDYIELPGNRLAVVLGDVSGKGVSAALLMARLSSDVRYCLASESTPAAAMNRINASFSRSGWQDRFVTFVLAVIDANNNEVAIVNAGHMAPLLHLASGAIEEIGANEAGLPLGVVADYEYPQATHCLAPGDLLVMFTDGISEAMNDKGDLYGLARLRERLAGVAVSDVKFGRSILEDVKQFVGGRAQSDDMCLVCFGRDGN